MNVHRFARSVWLGLPPALRRALAERPALRPLAARLRRRESPVVAVTSRQTIAIADLHARFAATPTAASPRPETGPPWLHSESPGCARDLRILVGADPASCRVRHAAGGCVRPRVHPGATGRRP